MRRIAAILASAIVVAAAPRPAEACGGYFPPPPKSTESISVATDHRIVVAIADTMVTVWDQVEFAGDPAAFAWVMPIKGRVAVGVGSDDFLQQLDDKTALQVKAPIRYCPSPGGCGGAGCAASSDSASEVDAGDTGVVELGRSIVGDYLQVQIRSKDEAAILAWLSAQSFQVSPSLKPVFAKYVKEGFDFLAVRLDRPKASGVRSMKPIRVSWSRTSADPVSIPLRMAAAGISSDVGIKLTVIAADRWKPANYPSYVVPGEQITWNFDTRRSDYVDARARGAVDWAGRAFAFESSAPLDKRLLGTLGTGSTIDATDSGVLTDTGPSVPDVAVDAETDGGATDAAAETATDAPAEAEPPIDAGTPPAVSPTATDDQVAWGTYLLRRASRFYARIPAEKLDVDLVLERDPDTQAELDRNVVAAKTTGTPVCSGASIAGDARTAVLEFGWLIALGVGASIVARRAGRNA